MNSDFRDLLASFLEAGVRFLVVGAHAMAVHGVPRATGDLDVWIAPDPGNADRAWSALVAFGAPLAAMGVTRADFGRPDQVVRVELTDDDARWEPAPDRFSVAEVLAHLSHSEGHCYRMRVDLFLAETRPTFEPDDAQMYLDLHRDADPEDAFDHFEEQRETNIEYLRDLPSAAGGRRCIGRPGRSP